MVKLTPKLVVHLVFKSDATPIAAITINVLKAGTTVMTMDTVTDGSIFFYADGKFVVPSTTTELTL